MALSQLYKFRADDVQLAFIANIAIATHVGENGGGTHQWNLVYADVVIARKVGCSSWMICSRQADSLHRLSGLSTVLPPTA